jgi:transcriptional repressor NrdR|tara:strand:+ start:1866 stop:2441 length:576 start_codon:yes stop_codon:yes gene_type:complete
MFCPFCNNDNSKVIDSRDSGDSIRRRRECLRCGLRFTTYERVQTRALLVAKRDGRREEFDREKLWASVKSACAKRPLPIGSIEKIIDEIETQLSNAGRAEIPSRSIGELVMERLRDLDRVAYIRFASVYRDFRDIESFKEEVEALLDPTQSSEESSQLSFLQEDELIAPGKRKRGRKPKKKLPGEGYFLKK